MRLALILVFVATLAGCAGMREAPSPLDLQIAELKVRILDGVALERARESAVARKLTIDPELERAAQAHAEAMAKMGAFDPDNPDGNISINALLTDPEFSGFVGENVAGQYFMPALGIDPAAYAAAFLNTWLTSESHRRNMLFAEYDRTGLGIAASDNVIYAALVFTAATRRPAADNPAPPP